MNDRVSTPRYRRVLQLAEAIAENNGHKHVGVEHLMLAIVDEGESVAAHALNNTESKGRVREELVRLMNLHPETAIKQ